MTGVHSVIAGSALNLPPFDIYSSTNTLHAGLGTTFTGTSGTFLLNGSTSHQVNSTTAATSSRDLLIISVWAPSAGSIFLPGDWSNLYNTTTRLVAYKVSNGGETSVAATTNVSGPMISTMVNIRGWSSSVPELATATGTSASCDAPSLSPSWGTASPTLYMMFGYHATTVGAAAPAPYNVTSGTCTIAPNVVTFATRSVTTASSSDPPGWTLTSSVSWVAHTVAVRGR